MDGWSFQQAVTVVLSVLSIGIAATALGWNIYRDVILRPRLRVHFGIYQVHSPGTGEPPSPSMLNVAGTNHGPGRLVVVMVHAWVAPFWRRLLRCPICGVVPHDFRNPLSSRLPGKLDVGETVNLFMPYSATCFLKDKRVTHVGLADSFGRFHWAPRRCVREARREWMKDFGKGTATRSNAR
jgi:hypothetical protein